MTVLRDVLDALKEWAAWKRITEAPDRLDALERRIAALENAGSAEACPYCRQPALHLESEARDPIFGAAGVMRQTWRCASCAKTQERERQL